MKLFKAITTYITYRQTLGDLFETNGRVLKAFADAMGRQRALSDIQPDQVLNHASKSVAEKRYPSPVGIFSLQEEGPRFRLRSWRVNAGLEPP